MLLAHRHDLLRRAAPEILQRREAIADRPDFG
jgi:hypothetical protein